MGNKKRILVIEDEQRMRHLLSLVLKEQGHEVTNAGDGAEGMALWKSVQPHVVLSDMKMPRAGGVEVLKFRNREYRHVPLILLTAFGTVESAVKAMKQGAYDYLTKPIDNRNLVEVVERALESISPETRPQGEEGGGFRMIGSSSAFNQLKESIRLVGATKMSVLITGESGTGKELVARSIHAHSNHNGNRLVRVNCAAIPKDLLESVLFGHVRGAFTGAVDNREGAFMQADGGALFLDEIGDLPLELQPKLLHAVEEKSISTVGAAKAQYVDVRIIAATNRDLETMVLNGLFREDLYHRVNIYPLSVPPLRHRRNDIPELARYFMQYFSAENGRNVPAITDDALHVLCSYHWPGNVRELRNVICKLSIEAQGDVISLSMLPAHLHAEGKNETISGSGSLDLCAQEKKLILTALQQCGWNQSESARKLGITRNTLRYRMKKYGISACG